MKKFITLLALIAMVSTASAVSFSWKNGTTAKNKVQFGDTALDNSSTVTATLVYLGSGDAAAWSITENVVDNIVVGTDTQLSDKGAFSGTFEQTMGAAIAEGTTDTFVNGATFGVYLSYTLTNDKGKEETWYNFAQTTYTVSGLNDPNSPLDPYNVNASIGAISWATAGEVDTLSASTAGWQKVTAPAVPEPGTAAVALLGLALVLKRRK